VTEEEGLEAEADALHRAVFGRAAPAEIARRYAEAHLYALTKVTEAERDWMTRARGADLEALELSVRRSRPDHVLTRKLRTLVYLCEASPEYFGYFVNETPGRFRAIVTLAWHVCRTAVKALSGWLVRKTRGL
jgi:hypothetical protein